MVVSRPNTTVRNLSVRWRMVKTKVSPQKPYHFSVYHIMVVNEPIYRLKIAPILRSRKFLWPVSTSRFCVLHSVNFERWALPKSLGFSNKYLIVTVRLGFHHSTFLSSKPARLWENCSLCLQTAAKNTFWVLKRVTMEGGVGVYKKPKNRSKNYPKPKNRDRFRSKP